MTFKKDTKKLTKIGMIALAAVVATAILFQDDAASQQFQVKSTGGIGYVTGSDAFLERGGDSAVIMSTNGSILESGRGNVLTTSFTLSHETSDSDSPVEMKFDGVSNGLILPSAVESQTPQERVQSLQKGLPVPGTVELDPLVSYSPSHVVLNAGESKTIIMQIMVPSDLPEEMVGKHLRFVPDLAIVDGQGKIGTFPEMITVRVTR